MKLTNSGFQRGYNPIVVGGDASDMNMDFGERYCQLQRAERVHLRPGDGQGYLPLGGQGGDRGAQILLP